MCADMAATNKIEPFWLDVIKKKSWNQVITACKYNPERNFHAATIYDEKLYIYGGQCEEGRSRDVVFFDFDKLEWVKLEEKGNYQPKGRTVRSHCVYNNKWIFYGGFDVNRDTVDLLEIFDFETKEWKSQTYSGTLPGTLNYPGYWKWRNYFYLWGGTTRPNEGDTMNLDMFRLNLDTFVWERVKFKLNNVQTVHRCRCVIKDNDVYIFGGQCVGDCDTAQPTFQLAKLDLLKNEFTNLEMPPQCSYDAGGALGTGILSDVIFFTHGWNYGTTYYILAYHTKTNKYYEIKNDYYDGVHAHICLVHNGKLLTHGGWTGSEQLRQIFEFDVSEFFLAGEWVRTSHHLYPHAFKSVVKALLLIRKRKGNPISLLPKFVLELVIKILSTYVY